MLNDCPYLHIQSSTLVQVQGLSRPHVLQLRALAQNVAYTWNVVPHNYVYPKSQFICGYN
jgi:hypothetical protein